MEVIRGISRNSFGVSACTRNQVNECLNGCLAYCDCSTFDLGDLFDEVCPALCVVDISCICFIHGNVCPIDVPIGFPV